MGDRRSAVRIVGAAPTLLIATIAETLSLLYFYPEIEGVMLILLLLVLAGSLLLIGTSWMQISLLPTRLRVRNARKLTARRIRRKRGIPLAERVLGWLYSLRGGRIATMIVLLVFFLSLSLVFLMTSDLALSVYREIYASTPESVQPSLRTAYGIASPLMRLGSVEKCLLAQNLPALSVATISLVILRRRK